MSESFHFAMNLQSILEPIRDLIVWTFELVLESDNLTGLINYGVVFLGIAAIAGWLRMQSKYTKQAVEQNTIV